MTWNGFGAPGRERVDRAAVKKARRAQRIKRLNVSVITEAARMAIVLLLMLLFAAGALLLAP